VRLPGQRCFSIALEFLGQDCPRQEEIFTAITNHEVAKPGVTTALSTFGWAGTDEPPGLELQAFVVLMAARHNRKHTNHQQVRSAAHQLAEAFHKEEQQHIFQSAEVALHERELLRAPPKAGGTMGILLDIIPACVILTNALVMGLESDIETDSPVWEGFEVVFLFCYITEGAVKIKLFGILEYLIGFDRYWNWFDIICITLSLVDLFISHFIKYLTSDGQQPDIGGLMVMKMLRLVRLARLVRALQYPIFDDLKAMVYGVVSGIQVLLWAIVLLVLLVFFVGVILRKFMDDHEEMSTMPAAMFTVFRCLTDGCAAYDGTPLQERIRDEYGAPFLIAYILVFMFVTFGVFNLIMAIFIDNVVTGSVARKQAELGESRDRMQVLIEDTFAKLILNQSPELREDTLADRMEKVMHKISPELKKVRNSVKPPKSAFESLPKDTSVSRDVFNLWLQDPEVGKLLDEAGIDTANKFELFDVLDSDMGGQLDVVEIIQGLMTLRGPVTKADIVAMSLKVGYVTKLIDDIWNNIGPVESARNSRP